MYFYISKVLAPLLNPTNFIFFILIILFVIYLKNRKKVFLNLLFINLSILIAISFLPLGNLGLKFLEKNYFNQKELKNIKNIVVLSGSERRVTVSIRLANKFNNSEIFFIGGNGYLIKNNKNDELIKAKQLYKDLNFDLRRVNFVGNSRNTIENFNEIKKLKLINSETILITSAYHMKRSMMIAKKQNLHFHAYASDFKYISQKFFLNQYQAFNVAKNLGQFDLFFREVVGIIAFKIAS